MLLSELSSALPLTVIRDGRFQGVGLIGHPGNDLLVALYQPRYLNDLLRPTINCVITVQELTSRVPAGMGIVVAADPKATLYDIHEYLCDHTNFYGDSSPSSVASSAKVHPRAFIAPEDVYIADGAVVEANVTILPRVRIGPGAVIRAGSVIGAAGFNVRRTGERQVLVRHSGWVDLAAGVQVLPNCTIAGASFGGATSVGQDTIINSHAYLAHNVQVGRRCRIAAGVIITGSVVIGDDVWIGPGATIANSLCVGEGASVSLGAVVVRNVAPGEQVSGHFAMAHRRFLRFLASAPEEIG